MHMNISEAAAHLPHLVEAALRGEQVFLTKGDEPLILFAPVVTHHQRTPGSAKGMVHVRDDFDDPLDEFREHCE